MFYLIRHGETDYSERGTKLYQGMGVNLSPLTERGVRQLEQTALDPRLKGADLILSSPYTRALQSAAILSRRLDLPILVETGLHEWMADKSYRYAGDGEAALYYREFQENAGRYPAGTDRPWESAEIIRERVNAVLRRYADREKVLVVCHGTLMQAVTGRHHPVNGEIMEYGL